MRVILVGADLEENLGMCTISAVLSAAGHSVVVLAFNRRAELERLRDDILARAPDVVGLSIQFQHRSFDFLSLSRALRSHGYRGHITCGGQFPSLAYREVLSENHGVDSIVLHEGERTVVELLDALGANRPLSDVAGLALPSPLAPVRTAPRSLEPDLDVHPMARRYRPHARHFEVPFIPIMGGRGCWGSCSFCSITTFYRDARAYGGGRTVRLRSPRNVATEMATLWHGAGARSGIFCFHDDNFLLPRAQDTLDRVRSMVETLQALGVDRHAFIGKARPDCITPSLMRDLRALGLIRLYVGVENVSLHGAEGLNRTLQTRAVRQALAAAREADIFTCYNLLLFEPDTVIDDVRQNIAFIREHAMHPVNFCRAEPYYGTPLHHRLLERGALSGSYLGFDYRLVDDRAELLFRICSAAFRERNFGANGVGNRYMGLGYGAKILEHFHTRDERRRSSLVRRASELTRGIALETADFLEQAVALAEDVDLRDHDRVERETALLGLRIADADAGWHVAIDALNADMREYGKHAVAPVVNARPAQNHRLMQTISGLAIASTLGWVAGCGGKVDEPPVDSGPKKDTSPDTFVVDPVPIDSWVVDALPPDEGVDFSNDPVPPDSWVVDDVPPDLGVDTSVSDTFDGGEVGALDAVSPKIDHWQDTTPRRAQRTTDLALSVPPSVSLAARREGERILVRLEGCPGPMTVRWQSSGQVEGDGREIAWIPGSREDLLRVAVRTHGGVAVLELRAT